MPVGFVATCLDRAPPVAWSVELLGCGCSRVRLRGNLCRGLWIGLLGVLKNAVGLPWAFVSLYKSICEGRIHIS